jgi:isopentenyldiphosphate isomerase
MASGDHGLAQDPDELLVVVDPEGREIGAYPRAIVHRENMLHRAVHVLVEGPQGGWVFQRRSEGKDTYPGLWECVGGHLGPGEDWREAALREVREELGVEPEDLGWVGRHGPSEKTGWEFIEVFSCWIRQEPQPSAAEVAAVEEWPWPVWESRILRALQGISRQYEFAPGPLATLRTLGWLGA